MSNQRLPDINSVLIVGVLLEDPRLEELEDGRTIGRFRILSSRKFRDQTGQTRENRCEVDVIVYQRLADLCMRNLRAGSPVLLDGELISTEDSDEEGTRGTLEIRARRVQFLERALRPVGAAGPEPAETEVEGEATDLETQEPSEWDFGYRELEL